MTKPLIEQEFDKLEYFYDKDRVISALQTANKEFEKMVDAKKGKNAVYNYGLIDAKQIHKEIFGEGK